MTASVETSLYDDFYVSMLIDLDFSPHLIAERISDTVDMVNNVYGHLYPNRHIEVAEKLQEIVSYQYLTENPKH